MERQSLVLGLAVMLGCVGCTMDGPSGLGGGGNEGTGGVVFTPFPCTPPTSVSIAVSEDSVEAGRAITLERRAPGAAFCAARWSSSDSSVATLRTGFPFTPDQPNATVAVVGVEPGVATITVDVGGMTATALIRVTAARTSFVSVSVGGGVSCAVASDGRAYCWGGFTNSPVPLRVPGGAAFRSLSAGTYRVCGVTTEGALYCWGYVWDGTPLFWSGGRSFHPEPVLVSARVRFISVDAGKQDHACGVTADSAGVCWGDNTLSQLGIGYQGGDLLPEPQLVAGGLRFASVVAGEFHSCALTGAGVAYCWGMAYHGQLGNGPIGTGASYPAAPVAVSGGLTFRQLSAGDKHTCGVTTSGTAYCWGLNSYGQLGSGDTVRVSVPQAVAGSLSFTSVGAGSSHSCGLTTSGDVYCWGAGYSVAGGAALVPTRVEAVVRFTSLSVGGYNACGFADDGRVYCWGWGVLGDGSDRGSYNTPVRVSGQP